VDVADVLSPDVTAELADRSMNGTISMSPTVPPISTMITSTSSSASRLIRS